MNELPVKVIVTGTANNASVFAGLRRAGARPSRAESAEDIRSAPAVMLPGVGAFGPAMETLEKGGLVDAIRERVLAARPTLAICLGLQLLFESSDESPGRSGLGVLPGRIRRFDAGAGLRIPQLGWNRVTADDGCKLLTTGEAYFANSFRCTSAPEGWATATTDHGGAFISALERGGVLACQFHPELSDRWGLGIMTRWVEYAREEAARC